MTGEVSAEKNKAAQKRYRERKKEEVLDLKREVARLNSELAALRTENNCLEVRNRVLGKTLEVQTAQRQQPREAEPHQAATWGSARLQAALKALAAAVGQGEGSDDSAFGSLEDIKKLHSALVLNFSRLLHAFMRSKDRAAEARLEEYALKHRHAAIDLLKALDAKSFAQLHQFRGISPDLSEATLTSAVEAAAFTASQKQAYCAARRELLERCGQIKKQRARDCDLVKGALSKTQLEMSRQSSVLEACQAIKDLQRSFQDMYDSVIKFYIDCIQIHTPVQEAQLFVETYPGVPDPYAVANFIANQIAHSDAEVMDPLQAGKELLDMMVLPELDDWLEASLEENFA